MSIPALPQAQDQGEQQIGSALIHTGRVIRLTVDEVALSDGRRTQREVVHHRGAVAILPLNAEGKVILVHQYRYPAGRFMLEVPAGGLEENEEPIVCAHRELQEEIGFRAVHIEKIGGVYLAPGYSTEFIHLFAAWELVPSVLPMDDDEMITVATLSFAECLQAVTDGVICDAKTITAMYLARERYPDKFD